VVFVQGFNEKAFPVAAGGGTDSMQASRDDAGVVEDETISGVEIIGECLNRGVFDSLLSAVENEKAGIFAVGRWMPRNQFLGEGVVVEIQFGHAQDS